MTKKAEPKSLMQQKADDLRKLKQSIADYERIQRALRIDVDNQKAELMKAESNLRDTEILLTAQKIKLTRDIDDMSTILEHELSALER